MKCDIILYSKTAAVGLKSEKTNSCYIYEISFKTFAKDCPANNFCEEWEPKLLEKILQKAFFSEFCEGLTNKSLFYLPDFLSFHDIDKNYSIIDKKFLNSRNYMSEESYPYEKKEQFQAEIKRILQKQNCRNLLLKQVHCVQYLKRAKAKYCLERNERDNNWYYRQMDKNEKTFEKAGDVEESWKHNVKYELKEREFSGVVVKTEVIQFSTLLGIDLLPKEPFHYWYTDLIPAKIDGFSIPVATVFYKNGRKRLVPLSCIKEYEGFSNGANIERVIKNIETVENYGDKNLITQKKDGTIEIDNSFLYLDFDFNVKKANRKLVLDVANRIYRLNIEKGDIFIKISDAEFKIALEMMKKHIMKECGFEPNLVYGETNFDRLINFVYAPFNSELGEFRNLFKNHYILDRAKENYGKEFLPPNEGWDDLARSTDCVQKFFKMCDLPYTPKTIKIFHSGHRNFANLLGIWRAGFRCEKAINFLMNIEEKSIFGAMIFQWGFFYNSSKNDKAQICFDFSRQVELFQNINFLFKYYDEMTCAKLTAELLKSDQTDLSAKDAFYYMEKLVQENNLSEQIIKKIGREGFTQYNHDMLMRVFRQSHPEQKEQFENLPIAYSPEEKQLEWENDGYKFCLPEDTNRLVDIGYRMNICVGHLYREKAAQKQCDIVYAIKNDEYELCVELRKTSDNRFEVVQRSAFSNREPKGRLLAAFNSWRMAKNVG